MRLRCVPKPVKRFSSRCRVVVVRQVAVGIVEKRANVASVVKSVANHACHIVNIRKLKDDRLAEVAAVVVAYYAWKYPKSG